MIDVITINKNNIDGLRKTIESVVCQTRFDQVNMIVIDGGSDDGSVDVIKQYQDRINYWVSEKDDGIYHAMNKGIDVATGDYCIFLNSGDYFSSNNVIERILPELDRDIVYGDEYKDNGKTIKLSKYPSIIDDNFFRKTALPHQSTFIRTRLLKNIHYSTKWKLLGDSLWFYERIVEDKVGYKHISLPISVYNLDGISSRERSKYEEEKREYFRRKGIIYG